MSTSHYPQAESHLSFTCETQSSIQKTVDAHPPKSLNMQGADVILQSSDLISFQVHKSTLAISSPFFNDLFSLPQPQPHNGEVTDGLPVVRVSEDAEVLHSLLTLLYPIPSVIPDSYEKSLALLAISEKYSMDTVSATVRSKVVLPTTKAAFGAYAIASSKQLLPEMEAAARLTLDHPMTFEILLDALPLFEGSALLNLVRFRERCHDKFLSFFVGFVDGDDGQSKAWYGCRKTKAHILPFNATKASSLDGFKTYFFGISRICKRHIPTHYPKLHPFARNTTRLSGHISLELSAHFAQICMLQGEKFSLINGFVESRMYGTVCVSSHLPEFVILHHVQEPFQLDPQASESDSLGNSDNYIA